MHHVRIFVGLVFSIAPALAQPKGPIELQKLIDTVSVTNLANHVKALQSAGGVFSRVNFTPGNDSAVAYIKREFSAMSHLTSVEYDTFYIPSATPPLNSQPLVNIVATIKGKDDPSKIYVLGAHMDCSASRMGTSTWNSQWRTIRAPGADDNATGVSAILELARILSDSSLGFWSAYTLRFAAFGAEESGPAYPAAVSHPGSDHYVKAAKARGDNILGMVSVDMIGYNRFYDFLAIIANPASLSLGRAFLTANDSNAIGLLTNKPPFANATYSDHNSFWLQGYPAVCLIENAPPWNDGLYYKANPYYHTSADSFETVNMPLVRKITQVTLAAIASLSGSPTSVGTTPEITDIPQSFVLCQNYPNPFNPTTVIRYQVPGASQVQLAVCDILGRQVETLVNERKEAGTYSMTFNASNLSSGIYIYRMSAGGQMFSKKMIVLK